jgi:hypothetical protein
MKTIARKIDELDVLVIKLPSLNSIRLFGKLSRTVGPILKGMGQSDVSKLQGLFKPDQEKTELSLESGLDFLAGMLEGVHEDRVEDLIKSCLISDYVKVNGRPISDINLTFENPITVLKVVLMVLEVNYKDFLSQAGFSQVKE